MYGIESALVLAMLLVNFKPIKELVNKIFGKFLKKSK